MKLTMDLGRRGYDIIIKRGALGRVGRLTNLAARVMVVTDEGIPPRYVKTVLAQCGSPHSIALPVGDKSPAAWQAVLDALNEAAFGPGDMVVALGGGCVGDVAGFAAATYLRGVPLCQLPTSTTAQLDSAVGGRCGIDVPGAANLVGAWHQPVLVAVDPDLLDTLPPRHTASGMAQALKTGLVASRELLELLEAGDAKRDIERILYLCLRAKADIVAQDETGQNLRGLLSFGYTVGAAIDEACPGALLHGEWVALGMLPLIESRTLVRRARAVMKKLGLPLAAPCETAKVLAALGREAARWPNGFKVARVKNAGHGYLETLELGELSLLVSGE